MSFVIRLLVNAAALGVPTRIVPGVTFGWLFDIYRDTVERQGQGKYLWSHPVMHARGLGDDGPALLGDKDLERFSKIELKAGMTFILKPQVRPKEGKGRGSITVPASADRAEELHEIGADSHADNVTDRQRCWRRRWCRCVGGRRRHGRGR